MSGGARARWSLAPSPKISRQIPRVVPAAVTEARARACIPRIPITRIVDLTPLDPLGLPVFSVVTPLARDLTTCAGKGPDAESARVSALMEAIERASAEAFPGATRRASFADLAASGAAAVDPRGFDLPDDTAFAPDAPITWAIGWDFLGEREVLVPVDLVISPPAEGVLREVDTNGLASGNTLVEATLHGLCEIIERDAASQLLFAGLFAEPGAAPPLRPVDPRTLPDAVRAFTTRITEAGLVIVVADATTEIGVATFKATLVDDAFPGPEGPAARTFLGFGTHPSAEVAARRAVTEAVQARASFIVAARDAFNLVPEGGHAGAWRSSLRELSPGPRIPFDAVPTFESPDVADDLRHVLGRLRRAGATHVVAVDLTRPDLDVPVVRVRVPGLASFLGNRRRVGWRCLRHLL